MISGPKILAVTRIDVARFNSDWWRGPEPAPETALLVSLVRYGRRYRVTVERVLELVGD